MKSLDAASKCNLKFSTKMSIYVQVFHIKGNENNDDKHRSLRKNVLKENFRRHFFSIWNPQMKPVPLGSVLLFCKVVMWQVTFSLSVHRNTCSPVIYLTGKYFTHGWTPFYWYDKLSGITAWGDMFKCTMRFLPGWAGKLFQGVIIENVHERWCYVFCSDELRDAETWRVIRQRWEARLRESISVQTCLHT